MKKREGKLPNTNPGATVTIFASSSVEIPACFTVKFTYRRADQNVAAIANFSNDFWSVRRVGGRGICGCCGSGSGSVVGSGVEDGGAEIASVGRAMARFLRGGIAMQQLYTSGDLK